MQTKIEGLLIQKIPYRERDIIGQILMRNGRKVSVIFYGGRSGGKKYRSSVIEIGHMLSLEVRRPKILNEESLLDAREWSLKWNHSQIRSSVKAYYLLMFYVEMIQKVAVKDDLSLFPDSDKQKRENPDPFFRVLSNAVFYLDAALLKKCFRAETHFQLFLGKLIFELGITPVMTHCVHCGQEFHFATRSFLPKKFIVSDGGFSCLACFGEGEKNGDDTSLFKFLNVLKLTPYADVDQIDSFNHEISKTLFQHISYHCNLGSSQFNTLKNFM